MTNSLGTINGKHIICISGIFATALDGTTFNILFDKLNSSNDTIKPKKPKSFKRDKPQVKVTKIETIVKQEVTKTVAKPKKIIKLDKVTAAKISTKTKAEAETDEFEKTMTFSGIKRL
jgi:hypothetical protein